MNAIYKVIWNDALRLYQVVNEMCRSRRKACSVKAVHMEGSGRTLKRSVLATAAAVTMMAGGGAFAMDLPGMVIDLGGGRVTTELPTYEVADLPSAGESIEIDLRESSFTGLDQNIFNQDEADRTIGIFRVNGSWSAPDGLQITFVDENGDPVPSGLLGIDNNNFATFLYDVNFGGYNSYTHLAQGSFVLKQIDLTEDNGTYGQYLEVGTEVQDSPYPDLKATLTGGGNITFGYGGTAQHGYLTLAGDGTNIYSGRTFVGYTSDGQKSAAPTTIFFGKTEAFGNTLNLNVESDSEVFISGESKTEDYFQRVHGLQGEGLIDLGTRANLELAQSGKTTGNYDDAEGVIRIDNKFTGSGNTTDPASGAWIDIKLSDAVAGDIVRFSNDASEYTGVIALTDATIEGYDATRKLDLNGGTYSPNKILTTSTLRLESGGQLLIDGTSVDSLYNLVLNNNQGWTDDGNNRNALSFKNVQLGEAALNVTGKLTLESDGTVSIDNLTDGGLEGAVSGKSFFDADNGLENALIVVSGGIVTNGHELALDGKIKGESGTDVMQGNDHVADAHWKFDDKLVFEDGATSDSFNIRYTLTQIDILDGKTFTLSTEENSATSGQDFSALISGSGDLKVDASGYTVNIGHSGGNTFTGDTEVTDGTNVILTENSGFGTGSGTLTIAGSGSVTLGTGVKQSGSGLSGTGSLVLGSGAEYALTQNSDANITNKIDGSGTLKVDLGSSGHELTFGSTNPFSGWLDLTNGSLNLSKNADALSTSNIILGENTNFTFGSGSKVESLTVTGNADLNADTLIIGGDAVLTVNGALSFDSGRSFDVSNVVVADNINLIDFDGGLVDNKFITAGSVTNAAGDSFGINVADEDANTSGQQVVRNYTQDGTDPVAETTWTIGSDIDATGTALNAQVQLTKIDVLDGKSLSIAGDASAQKELVAQLSSKSASGSIVFKGGSILVSNSSNDYQVATRIENGTTVTLGASNSLGRTSELANYGSLVIGQGITQNVTGWDQVASGSIALDGSLKLDQTGGQTIANSFTGNGTFSVNLGGSGNALVFSNTGALTDFTGTLALSNLLFDVANSTNYDSMLESTDIALNGGAIFNADASGSIHTSDFTFNGGTLRVGDIEAGNNTGAKVSVSGDIVISSDSTIEVEGVKLEGTSNILAADDGIKQTIAEFSGSVSGSLDDLLVTGVGTSEIRNASTDENPAAYGVWSAGDIAEGNKTLDVGLTLQKIQLADATNGLKLNAFGLSTNTILSATITDYNKTAGRIVFEGGDITIGGDEPNTYTGETEVTGGTVTLAKDSGFGNTSKLSIASGAAVDLGGKNQTVGSLVVGSQDQNASNALRSTDAGTLTLGSGEGGESSIWGENDFSGTVVLGAGHKLAINNVSGIGDGATVDFGDSSVLTIDGATGGTFSTHLSGAGTVAVANSTFNVSGNNTAFTGTWQLGSSGNVTVSGTSTDIDNALGSGATLSFSGGGLSLKLAAGESALTIDEVLSGDGSLVVKGTTGQTFGLSSGGSGFAGTLSLDGIGMTVGTGEGTVGANNAAGFAGANLNLSSGSLLTVESSTVVNAFNTVTVEDSARFDLGALGFSAGLPLSGTTQLQIDALALENGASGTIILDPVGANNDILGAVNQTALISGGVNAFQSLIATDNTIDESVLGSFVLSGVGTGQVTQNIRSNGSDVATGYYNYDLALGDSGTDLGVAYSLTQVDIHADQTLTLSESGLLDAQLTSSSGAGNLTIAASGNITLTNRLNAYTGDTTVDAGGALTAAAGALGQTDDLVVSGSFTNTGANEVKRLTVADSGALTLNGSLTIAHAGYGATDAASTIAGALDGSGGITLESGKLTVTENKETDYSGGVGLGSGTVLELVGVNALGSGSVNFADAGSSQLSISDSGNAAFSNALTGGIGTITVSLTGSDSEFSFATNQSGLATGSKLVLDGAIFDLTSTDANNNDDVAQKLIVRVETGSTLTNDGLANKTLSGLELAGGTVDLGGLNGEHGQIGLNGGKLVIEGSNTIVLDSQAQVSESGDRNIGDGSDLLSGGLFELDIFTNVGDLSGSVTGLHTDSNFSGTTENLLQNADGDSELEHVANMTRDSGSFIYDDDLNKVYLQYSLKEIELLWTVDDQGLLVDAGGATGAGTPLLSARITGKGNLRLDGELTVGDASNGENDYTGKTYVLAGANVTAAEDSAFGNTQELNIENGATVSFGTGVNQTVGALAGEGTLQLGESGGFTIENYLEVEGEDGNELISSGTSEIVIHNTVSGASGATFTIDGAYGKSGSGNASVVFDDASNNLSGTTFKLLNANFNIGGTTDNDYKTASSSADFVLSLDSHVTMDAGALSDGEQYTYNELSFENGGDLAVTNVTLANADAPSSAVIETGVLDLTGSGTLSVSAEIDESFDILANDQDIYESTLIHYGELKGEPDNLNPSTDFSASEIQQHNETVAFVKWTGDIVFGEGDEDDDQDGTVGMSYSVESIQLYDESGAGLVLQTTNATGVDAALSALVTDYVDASGTTLAAGNITFSGGNITIGAGTADEKANSYTGTTYVTAGSVTLNKSGSFGKTELLNVAGGEVDFNGRSEMLGAINVGTSGSITGSGSVTLGSADYENRTSSISGAHSGFTADVVLANGHTLTLNDTLGIGSSGTVSLVDGTKLVINDALGGNFSKTVAGAGGTVEFSGSGLNITSDNSAYQGDWTLTANSTASASGTAALSADAILGSGGKFLLSTGSTLTLSQASSGIIVDNVFAGAGTLVVSGTQGQAFGFSTDWTNDETAAFTGTLSLQSGINMTVGGEADSTGAYNSANLSNADIVLDSASTITVATQNSVVDTFDTLTVNGGTIKLDGTFGLCTTTEALGQLQVGSLTGSGNIALAIPDSSDTVDQTIGQNDLLTIDDDSHFQALITAETGSVSENGWTLNGSPTTTGSGLRQAVRNADDTDTVAHAIYDYALATGKVNSESDSLGIEYTLKTVDIVDNMTLKLSDSGSLSAVITDSSGAGTLHITGQIELTGQNEYESVTRVSGPNASLTVGSSGLGNTTALLLESDVSFINEGINSAGYLNAGGSTIKLDEALTLTGGNNSTITDGVIAGSGALNVQKTQLTVSGDIDDDAFSGSVNLSSGADLVLDNVSGIGSGSVNFVSNASTVYVNGTSGTTLTNTYSGGGTISVDLSGSGNVFDFSQNQKSGAFTGRLSLENAGYHLYEDGGALASATLLVSGGSNVVVNTVGEVDDRTVGRLELAGGVIDFGEMTEGSEKGQIEIGGLTFNGNYGLTTLRVALEDITGLAADVAGSSVFDHNSGFSVQLIEGVDLTNWSMNIFNFSESFEEVQQVTQSGRHADGSATAELTYSNGHLVGNTDGISASWTLSQINLLSGNGEGFLINASGESGQSGTISALITGEGSIEFAGGTIKLNHANNTYTGNTYVTNGKLELAANEALGDSALLEVTGSGTVSVGSTAQSIGSISVAGENGLSMAGGSLTLTSGASTISGANDVSGTVALSGSNTTLTIQNASGVGGSNTTISLGDGTSVIFAVSGFEDGGTYAKINNKLSGAGTVQIGNGTDKMHLELLNTNNAFGKLLVTSGATVLVNDMHADNALGDAAVNIKSGGIARLYGSSGWTISNDLNLVEGGELVLAADDEAVNFAGTNQIISGGKVTLQSSVLYLGGDQGSSGATNAAVLDTAHLNVGSNGVLHVATGNDAQVLDKLTLGSSGHIWFDGTLGVSGTGTTQLGQLKVGSLGDMTGTIHLTASSAAGSGGEIDAAELLNVADSGSFQSLIEVIGTDETITNDELSGTNLDVSGNTSVVSDIKDGSGNTVAEGTFGFGGTLVATEDGKHAGVQYELQLINLLQTLEISESGSLNVQITGSGNLLVSNALTLTNKEGETNDYSGATTVSGTGSLVAGAGALGKTSALNVNESGSFTNSGDNTVGIFDLSGSAVLNEGTTLTVLGTTGETNDFTGTLTGSGSLALESGKTVVSQNNSGYAGNVVLGKKDGGLGAEIHFNAGASLGTGTITFAYNLGVLSVEASGETTLTNKLDLSADGGEIVVSGDGDDTFAFHADQAASGFGAGSKLTLTRTNYSFTTAGNDVLNNVALSVASGTLTVNGDADLSDRSVYGLSLTDAVVDFGKLGNGDGVLDLESQNLTIGGSSGSTTVRLDSEFQSVESDTGSAAFMQGGSLTLIRDASNDFSGDLSKLKLELDGAASAGTAIEQAVIQNNVETARLEGTAQGFGAVQGEDDGLWDLNLNLSFTTLRINKDRTFTVSEDGDIGLVITDNGADAAGSLSITGGASVQLLKTNSYHGETSVSDDAKLILAADNALGNTSALNTETGTSVAFGNTNQTIGEIHASGALVSDEGASGKLTITSGGEVSGANSGFHLDVDLTGNGDLTLTDVASLGTDNLVTITNAGAELVLAGAGGSFSNDLSGAGSLRIGAGSDVALTGENDLTGGLAVDASGKVSAGGNIYGHIGTGTVALAGEADFTLESQDTADWTWNNAVTGSGDLTLARDGSGSRDLFFKEDSLSGFGGTLTLDNWTIDLSETGGVKNATLGEIYDSALTDLTLTNGAQALVTGEVGLETKSLTLGDGGRLTLNGVGAPGSTGTDSAHITVDELHLEDGFNIDLGIKDASVESSDLLLQDSGSGTTIDVATAMNGIDGNLANGTVTVNGESSTGQTIRFDVEQSGSGAESGTVAEAIYGYGIRTSGDTGGQQDLQITYSLEGIDISSGKTLVLTGDADDTAGNGSVLSVYLTGEGNLRVAGNTVRLSDDTKQASDFKGTTTVTSGATLYAEEGTLGETARLTTESRAHTYIEGDNTVRGITLASGGQLAIGSTDSMGGASDVTLTIVSSTDGNTSADQINHLYGELHGHGDLKVVGNGQVDEGVAADLTIHGSQTTFYGDLVLTNGAWVDIAATDSSLFGNSSAGNKVVVYKDSLLTIESDRPGDASFYGVFTDGEDGSGGGTVEISLLNTSDHFRFAAAQSDADFTGTFVLNSGTIDFTDLFTSTSGSGDPLAGATLVLNDGGVVDLVGDGSGTSASNERNLGGLTMAGGTIEAGAIGYKEGEGAFNSTINLGSGTLTLEHAEGVADDRQSTVVLGTTDDPIQISDSGSEILNAGSVGANVTVISGIGDLVLVDGDTSETVSGSTVIGSDYLHAERPANGTAQEIEQKVILADGSSEYRSVAETVREYDENFTYNSESGTLSIGYKVSDLGLLYETGNVSSSNYADDSRWQGLTITANAAADGTSVFDALIKNGENGSATGNIVFKGAAGKGTITLAGDENTYTGKTWLTENAQVVFDTDSGFGNTAALRVDSGSSVDFAGHNQSMGALFALGDDALKSTDGANLAVNGTAIINGANANLHADWTFSGSVTIGDELSLGDGAVELAGMTTLTIAGSEANGTIGNAITGGELTNIYVTSGANVSFANADILSGPNFTGNIAVWSGASAGFAIESGATVSNGLTIGSTGKVSFESASGGTLAFEDANIYGTLELNNVTFDLDAHGDAFNRGSSLVANAGTRIDVSDAVSGAVSNITLNSGSTVAFDNGTPGAAGEGEVASINLGSSGTLTLAGDVTVDLDINDYADASDVEDAQGDLINRPLTAQDLTGQDGGAVLATLIAGQVSSDTADLNLKTDGNDVEENKLDIAIRNAANGEEVATGTYDYKLVLDKDGSGSGLKLSYGLTEVTIHDGKTLELTGTSADEDDNELTAAVRGTGNLRITEGEVTLVDKDSDYTGSTSVAAGAALVAGSAGHTLGETSELRLEGATGVVSGASATILGEETVYGLNVESGATLNLVAGSGEGAGAVLTVAGGEDGNVIAGNDALGQGGGKLAVSGDGTKLTVEGANSRFTGITSVESGAVLSAGNTASLGTGNTEIAAGGTLEVVAAVDATSGASRVVSQITNSVTGAGDVVINLSGTAQANQKMFRFADDQTSGFSGNIVLENGGYSLAYANDGDAETDYTANQLAAMNSRISVEENGHLYVSTVDHQINRYIDKHVRALTLNGGNIYFGGLRYDMTSMDESLGGQLQLAGDTDKSATLEIQSESFVNLDAGATNTLTDGSELLIADEGAKIDLIQNAADVVLGSGADTIWASSSDEADFTDLLNDYLKLNTVNSDAEQTLTQDGRDVAIVTRGFGSSGHNEVFGVEQNDSSTWDLYLNYHVSKIELIDSENTQGLLITNDEAGSYLDLTALVTGSGNLTLSCVSGTTIALGDGSAATQNDYTGRTTVTGSVTVKAAEDNAFGNTYRLNVESGAKVDFGEFDQTLGILEARGDDALAGTADSVVTITDDMIVTGKNDGFHSQVRLEFSGTGTVSDVGGLGTGDISIGKDYTLVIADENESDGNRVGNNITGSGTVVIGRDDATGTIELGGKNAGFTGNVRVENDWTLEASMGKGETAADRIGSGNLVLSNGATGSFTQTEGNLDWTSAVIGEGDLVLSAGKDSDVTISGGLDYFNGDITIGGGRFELASGNGNVENVDGSNLHATGEDTTVVVADQGTVILGDDLSVESGASIVFEGDVTPGTIGDAQLVVAGDLTITESNVTINVGGKLDPGDPDTASLNVQDVTSADRSDELALVIAEADNIVLSGNDLVVLGPDGNPINNPEDRLGVSIVDGEEEIATGYYDFGLTSSESGGRDILGVGYRLMEVNVKDGKTLVLNGAHAADVDYENASSFDADITGNGNFALANGELTLTGKNTYTGSTLVGDGTSETTLTVDRGSSLGDTSTVNVSDNATLVNRSDLTDAGSIQVASGGTVTLEDGSVFTVTDVANESNIAGTLTGSGALHLNDNVDIDVAADKAQNFTGIVSVGSGAVYNLLSNVTDTVTVASRFESDSGDDAVVGMTGDFSLEAKNTAYHGAFVLSDDTVIRTNSIASLGAADATITTAGDYAEAGGTASQADDNATVILDYADRETVGDVTQTMTSGITFVKTGDGVVELSAESLGAGAVKSSEGGIIFGAAGDSTVYGTALTVEGGAWAAGFGGVGSLSVASDGAFYLGGVDGYNSIVSSGWTSSEGSSTVQFTVSGNVTNNGTIYVGNKNSSGDTPADSNYIGNELVIEGDYITDGGTLDLNAIIAGKDNSKSDHVTIKGEIDGTGFIDVNYDSSVSTGGELEYLGLVSVAEGESGDSLKLKDSIKIGDLWYRLMWSSDQNEYYLQSSVTDPGDKPWDTEDVENVNAGTRSALAFMQAQAFDLSLRGHLGETLYVDPVTGEQRKSSFWMVQRGDWTKFSNASGQLDADGNLYTTHLGTDLFKRETDGATFRWGVLAGFADGDFDVSSNVDGKSSKGSFRGYSAGLYMTAESKAESGPFLGLQLRWNRFDNEVGPDDYDVNGLSLTAEASWDQLLSKGLTDGGRHYEWRLEPHVRAYWTNFSDPGNWTSRLGETYSSDFDNGLLVRVGARTKIQTTLGTGPAWQAYAEANWVYNNGDYSTTMSTQYGDVTSTQNGAEFAEFRLGLEAQFTTNVNVWLEGHHQTGSDDYESTGAMFGFKYMW